MEGRWKAGGRIPNVDANDPVNKEILSGHPRLGVGTGSKGPDRAMLTKVECGKLNGK